jgi:hypothetical protein
MRWASAENPEGENISHSRKPTTTRATGAHKKAQEPEFTVSPGGVSIVRGSGGYAGFAG